MKHTIQFKKGYKYQLHRDYRIDAGIHVFAPVHSEYIMLGADSILTIKKGYAWDGCSGPTIDTKTNYRAGLVHDALFQLMREGAISREYFQHTNRLFKRILKADGMYWFRRMLYFRGVGFTRWATLAKNLKKIITAP